MKAFILFLITLPMSLSAQEKDIQLVLDNWHKAAAGARFDAYFQAMTADAVYIGTDASENWNVTQFKSFAKPYSDKGKAWDFKPLERHIFLGADKKTAWFDELLDTWMGLCRGSGVMRLENGEWKIAHYVLSMTIPNDNVTQAVSLKKEPEEIQTKRLRNAKKPD
ncbi:MAG: hypothetical protein EOO10_18175 [Chitinophagaceae bacterium]|nr:MAG: hypothetical protein EOO10_18175 [Chitinophagaceae bacterium]